MKRSLAVLCKAPIYITTRTIEAIGVALQVERKQGASEPSEPMVRDPKPQYGLSEYVWRFMMDTQFSGIDEQVIATLKKESWDDLFPTRELTWEGEDVTAVRVSYENPTDVPGRRSERVWLLVPPYIWKDYDLDVKTILKEKQFPRPPQSVLPDPPMDEALLKEIDRIFSEGFQTLHALGNQIVVLMSRNGRMISGYSSIGPEEAEIFGINIVRFMRLSEFDRQLVTLPMCSGFTIYSIQNERWYTGLRTESYPEPIIGNHQMVVNGHWMGGIAVSPRSNENPETERLWNDLWRNKLKPLLPDLSDHYQMGYYSK